MREILKFLGIPTKENHINITFTFGTKLSCSIYAYDYLPKFNKEEIELKESDAYHMLEYLNVHIEEIIQSPLGYIEVEVNM